MAGRNIKGITIEIGGDTTKLDKALKGVNNSLRTAQSNLRDVNRLLKLDPKNTELLKQKYENLQSAIKSTKEKLETLKKAEEDLSKEMINGGTKEQQEQMAALKREIIATEQSLKSYEKEVGSGSAALAKVSAVTGEWAGKLEKVGSAMMPVTAGLTAMGAASVSAFKEMDESLDVVVAKTGATGGNLEQLQGIVKNLAKEIPTDFATAGEAVGEVSTRFHLTGDALEELSGQFVKFSELTGADVTSSVDQAQKALSAFGLGAEDASALLDRMMKTSQNTGASVDTLLSGLVQNGAAFQSMGLSIDQAVKAMGMMETSGANAETVMQGMRKAMKNAAADGKTMDQALSDLQNAILNGENGMDGLTAAYELFGKSGDQIYNAVKNGSLDFKEMGKAAGATGDAVSRTFEATLDPIDEFKTTLNTVKEPLAELGGVLLELLAPLLEKVAAGAQKVTQWWQNLSPSTQQLIVKIAGLAAAIGPLALGLSKVFSVVSSVTAALSKVGSVMGFLTSPVGLVIVAVGALVGAIILLWNKSEQFRNFVTAAWNAIKAGIIAAVNAIKAAFEKLKSAINTIKTAFNTVKTAITQAWNNIKTAVANGISNVVTTVTSLPGKIASTFTGLKDKALTWGKDMIQGFIDGITAKFQALKDKFTSLADLGKSIFGFSVPEEGPMSDADTWMPDMIDLFVKGIRDNEWRLKAAMDEMAGGMTFSPSVDAVGSSNVYTIEAMLARYLPQLGTQAIILDDGTLVGKLAPQMATNVNQINYRKSKL